MGKKGEKDLPKYIIVHGQNVGILQEQVNKKWNEGYRLEGSIVQITEPLTSKSVSYKLLQAMVLLDEYEQ